jgi:predicted enzyme related to lactoylglutathione lyase
MNFNSIMIGTEDVDRLRDFYAKLFGEPGFDEGGYSGWKIGDGFLTIGPHSEVHGKNGEPGRVIWNIETPDVAGDFARLKAAGAIVIRDPYEMEEAPGYPIATLADVDGNYFQLVAPMGSAEA